MHTGYIFLVIHVKLLSMLVATTHYGSYKVGFLFEEDQDQLLQSNNGGDLTTAIIDFIKGFPQDKIAICFDVRTDVEFIYSLLVKLEQKSVTVTIFNLSTADVQEKYFEHVSYQAERFLPIYTIFFGSYKLYEHVLLEIYERNLIRRNIIYIFNWGRRPFKRHFLRNIHYAMRVFAITNPRQNAFRLYYSQATSYKKHYLDMVNWWIKGKGLFNHPTLPTKKSIYKDFHGKTFQVPVLHKPPWHFVKYGNSSENDTLRVLGGRDDRILSLLSKKLNFRYNYADPPERIQGSPNPDTGSFNGVLGLISKRKADLFIGDVGITSERFGAVEFSFITLADSGAFVTHAPSRLNEALALLRPFQWQVWPAIGITCLIVGPFLYTLIALPNAWQPRFRVRSHIRLFFDCTWFTITILLKQTGREPSSSHKARFFIILLSISVTYVITDMYSANLTSLLARPGREKAINNLYQLKDVMEDKDYKLYVEKHSPSFGLLENGTGIYGEIWEIMEKKQSKYVVESVEEGVKLVREKKNVAIMAGRETLYFDIRRFGSKNFHLSEKLNTAYSAIALQMGCPYIEEINKILAAIFEAGIITKMTENEYEKLGKQKGEIEIGQELDASTIKETKKAAKVIEDNEKLKPISLKMLQGAFYILSIGNIFSGMVLVTEILVKKYYKKTKRRHRRYFLFLRKFCRQMRFKVKRMRQYVVQKYRTIMHDAFTHTLEYYE